MRFVCCWPTRAISGDHPHGPVRHQAGRERAAQRAAASCPSARPGRHTRMFRPGTGSRQPRDLVHWSRRAGDQCDGTAPQEVPGCSARRVISAVRRAVPPICPRWPAGHPGPDASVASGPDRQVLCLWGRGPTRRKVVWTEPINPARGSETDDRQPSRRRPSRWRTTRGRASSTGTCASTEAGPDRARGRVRPGCGVAVPAPCRQALGSAESGKCWTKASAPG